MNYQQHIGKQQGDSNFKAYGVPKVINGVVQQVDGGAGGGVARQGGYQHPNRQYVKEY